MIYSIGYTNSTIFLLILTGIYLLVIDFKEYKKQEMKKEKKTSLFLGWANIAIGCSVWLGFWINQHYF